MVLRTVAGRYAGEVRDYPFLAARAALATGTAVPVEGAQPTPSPPPAVVTKPTKHKTKG